VSRAPAELTIRTERPEDAPRIRLVHELAFGRPAEADLVDLLRRACPEALSLVAEDGVVVGHILFTPVRVESAGRSVAGMGLAPMAVLPDRQRQGIGWALVLRGLEILRARRCPFTVVLGHPEYYPRFGFARASAHGLSSPWEGVPDEAFLALALDTGVMEGVSGVVRYRDEFDQVV
jgi:putative acetyltransferase